MQNPKTSRYIYKWNGMEGEKNCYTLLTKNVNFSNQLLKNAFHRNIKYKFPGYFDYITEKMSC